VEHAIVEVALAPVVLLLGGEVSRGEQLAVEEVDALERAQPACVPQPPPPQQPSELILALMST